MQKLLAARVAGINRSHRLHHVIVTVHLVDEGDARLGILCALATMRFQMSGA